MMRRSNPFDEFETMFDRMNRQFEEMSRRFDESGMRRRYDESGLGRSGSMAVDVATHDDSVVVTADLPGFSKEQIGLTVANGSLTIRAERETTDEETTGEYVRRERRSSSFARTIGLPVEVDEDAATASYANGVLTVTLPTLSTDVETGHRIDID
jgi:HSP20 family protein